MSVSEQSSGIVAIYKYLDDVCNAMDAIKDHSDFKGYEVYSHTSYHELMERAESQYGSSQVKWFTLAGALTGTALGFGMCLMMDYDWPLVVGGKSAGIYSLPAYVIFGFELMVLLGALATIAGMLIMGRLPNPNNRVIDPRISDDRFAIYVPKADVMGPAAQMLKSYGAEEVRRS